MGPYYVDWADAMTMKLLLARILLDELTVRDGKPLQHDDYETIVDRLLEQITDLKLKLASREISEDRLR